MNIAIIGSRDLKDEWVLPKFVIDYTKARGKKVEMIVK